MFIEQLLVVTAKTCLFHYTWINACCGNMHVPVLLFFRFCSYNMHLLVWKTCIQQGKVWHRFSCSLNMPTGLQNGIDIAFFWIWPKRPKPTSTTCVPLSEIFHKDLYPKILTLSQEKGRFAQSLNMALGVGMASKRSHFSSWKDSWWKWHVFFVRLMASFKLQLSSSPKMQAETCFQYTQSLSRGKNKQT